MEKKKQELENSFKNIIDTCMTTPVSQGDAKVMRKDMFRNQSKLDLLQIGFSTRKALEKTFNKELEDLKELGKKENIDELETAKFILKARIRYLKNRRVKQ